MSTLTTVQSETSQSTTIHDHYPVVQELKDLLDANPDMASALEFSLQTAVLKASSDLNTELYQAIDNEFQGNGWPTTVENYLNYLDLYVRLVPNEEDDPIYPNAWKSNDKRNGYNQKVYDLLCQFYWLVDQKVNKGGKSLQNFPKFAAWLVLFAKAWGAFLNTKESLTRESLASFKHDRMYNFDLYKDGETSWTTFNEFFYREFNGADAETGISPLRPIADPTNNNTIVAPADCTYKMMYPIDSEGNVLDEEGGRTQVVFKGTHAIGTIDELLDGSQYAKDFYGGTFVHYFLSPFDYHRFHTPIQGTLLELRKIIGKVFLNVDLLPDGQWDAPDGANDGYEFTQARGLVIVDGGSEVGKIAALPIGMAQVSGVDMYTDRLTIGQEVAKGQEFGKFKFGGSDIILLFEKNPDLYLFEKDPGHVPIHFQYGQTAAYWKVQ